MDIHYGFDYSGGFFAILHGERTAEYAYASSPNAIEARKRPAEVAKRMIETRCVSTSADIRERHYEAVSAAASI